MSMNHNTQNAAFKLPRHHLVRPTLRSSIQRVSMAVLAAFSLQTLAADEPRFNFSVNNAPAQSVFAALGAGSKFNVIVPDGLEGRVTINLKNVTLVEALQAISDSHGHTFRIDGNKVTIASNALTTRVFKVNYLTGNRQGSSQLRVQSGSFENVQGAAASGGGGQPSTPGAASPSGASGSGSPTDSSRVSMSSNEDFWRDTKSTLSTLISGEGRSVVMNPAAGVIVVRAFPKEIALLEQYLKAIQVSVQRQVMIEAKIVEVSLSDGSQSGINWSVFGTRGDGSWNAGVVSPSSNLGQTGPVGDSNVTVGSLANTTLTTLATRALGTGFYGLAFQGANFAGVLNFLETQGGVQVLSSPRIATLNNQKALLKVGNDEFFVTNVSTNTTTSGTSTVTTPSITLTPFFSGISLDVTPQIDDDGVITMHIHPAISNVREKNKLIDLGALGQYQIPSASSSVNETDSMVRIKTGQIAAIGGLMSASSKNDSSGLPGLSKAPVIGGLFGQKSSEISKRELVILIKPTIVDESSSVDIDALKRGGMDLLSSDHVEPTGAKKPAGQAQ